MAVVSSHFCTVMLYFLILCPLPSLTSIQVDVLKTDRVKHHKVQHKEMVNTFTVKHIIHNNDEW